MNKNKSINVEHRSTVAAVTDLEVFSQIGSIELAETCDIVEFRLDGLAGSVKETLEAMKSVPIPCIATARHPEEGGEGNLDSTVRAELLMEGLPHASILDIEIRSLGTLSKVVAAAAESDSLILGSFHDFQTTPSLAVLKEQASKAVDLGATALKFATRLHSSADLFRIIDLLESHGGTTPTSVMGMGPLGRVSRLLAAQCGSFLNYGYLRSPNAPGQWPAHELKRLIAQIESSA